MTPISCHPLLWRELNVSMQYEVQITFLTNLSCHPTFSFQRLVNEEPAWKLNTNGGADALLGEKQWMWRHLHPERATTSFQMRPSQSMMFPIALSTLPSSLCCVSAPCIGLVSPVPHSIYFLLQEGLRNLLRKAGNIISVGIPPPRQDKDDKIA
jgi:hypothetical protein